MNEPGDVLTLFVRLWFMRQTIAERIFAEEFDRDPALLTANDPDWERIADVLREQLRAARSEESE